MSERTGTPLKHQTRQRVEGSSQTCVFRQRSLTLRVRDDGFFVSSPYCGLQVYVFPEIFATVLPSERSFMSIPPSTCPVTFWPFAGPLMEPTLINPPPDMLIGPLTTAVTVLPRVSEDVTVPTSMFILPSGLHVTFGCCPQATPLIATTRNEAIRGLLKFGILSPFVLLYWRFLLYIM